MSKHLSKKTVARDETTRRENVYVFPCGILAQREKPHFAGSGLAAVHQNATSVFPAQISSGYNTITQLLDRKRFFKIFMASNNKIFIRNATDFWYDVASGRKQRFQTGLEDARQFLNMT